MEFKTSRPAKLSVYLVIRSLEPGGAQRQLVALAKGLHKRGDRVRVALFYAKGEFLADLQCAGVEIIDLRKRGRWRNIDFLYRLARHLWRDRPDVVYSFLGGANLMCLSAAPFAPKIPLVWSIRDAKRDRRAYDRLRRLTYKLECALSGKARLIIANSHAGRRDAIAAGFSSRSIVVVPNGIDASKFSPNQGLRLEQRRLLGVNDDDIVIGVLARFDPVKGYRTFLQSAAVVARRVPQARFVCAGNGPELEEMKGYASDLEISPRVVFPGAQGATEMLAAFDIFCSPSISEGFSNAVAEAMACGLPTVVTDVGDSSLIVSCHGRVVPPSDPSALAAALIASIESLHSFDGGAARARIVEHFSIETMVEATREALLSATIGPKND